MSKPTPSAHPDHPVSGRLADIAKEDGGLSFRAVHERLTKDPVPESARESGGGIVPVDERGLYQISYEAVRNYHYDRLPPLHYCSQVARVFGWNLLWIVEGEGPPKQGQGTTDLRVADARNVFDEEMNTLFRPYGLARPSIRDGIASVWWDMVQRRVDLQKGEPAPPLEVSEAAKGAIGRDVAIRVGRALVVPLTSADGDVADLDDPGAVDAYLLALTQALAIGSRLYLKGVVRGLAAFAAEEARKQDDQMSEADG